ncbi:transposase [Pseudomonas sp. WS 5011]|nr:transposase [Pseudomonas sp. WS 5011]
MEAYKMALFSMALDKVKFCELFGINIRPEEWPCYGLSGGVIFDRGPGATYGSEPEINWLGSIELTPSYSGQSKATVESSHPRDKKSLEQPTYFQSKLNFVLMARREIYQALADNQSSDASGRVTEEMIINRVKPTPHDIWNFLDGRGRNSAIGMPFDEAVRTFLTEHPVTIRKDAVYFYGRKYRSTALIGTNVFDKIARAGVIKSTAFALTMCVRHIWIELDGLLFELDFVSSATTPEGSVDITLSALKQIDKIRREHAADLRDEIPAIQQEFRDRFKKDTGEDWDSGQRKQGRPTKGGAARRDTDDFNRFTGKAK